MEPIKITDAVITRCVRQFDALRQFQIMKPQLSWAMLVALDPALGQLLDMVRHADSGGESFCARAVWNEELKPELVNLVGFGRRQIHPVLSASAAYDVAYGTLLRDLPHCRDCHHCG